MSQLAEQRQKFTNIYVKNLPSTVASDSDLNDMYAVYGTIVSAAIQTDEVGKSRGFGFVNFEDHDDAARAVDDTHEKVLPEPNGPIGPDGTPITERRLYVTRAQKKSEREDELRRTYEKMREERMSKYQGVNLFVKNLDDVVTDEDLRAEFSVYGTITSAKVMRNEAAGSKGKCALSPTLS